MIASVRLLSGEEKELLSPQIARAIFSNCFRAARCRDGGSNEFSGQAEPEVKREA